jgi:hypothetical protein
MAKEQNKGGAVVAQRRDPRIDELRDERREGNGWFVYLKPGFQMDGAHCFGEDRLRDVWATMVRVKPCGCDECSTALAKSSGEGASNGN